MRTILFVLLTMGLAAALAPPVAAKGSYPPRWTAVSAAARTDWPREWCYLRGRRGDPKLFLQQQARGCF